MTACGEKEDVYNENTQTETSQAEILQTESSVTVSDISAEVDIEEEINEFPTIRRSHEIGDVWENESGYTVTTCENFDIAVESDDIYVSPDLEEQLNDIISACEDATGLKYNPEEKAFSIISNEYPTYYFSHRCNGYIEYSVGGDVFLYEEEAAIGDLTNDYSPIVHETIHGIVARNFCMFNSVFSEGYAEYYTEKALEILGEKYGHTYYGNDHKNNIISISAYGQVECDLDIDFTVDRVSIEEIENYFFLTPRHEGHEPSYYIVAYFLEKYGEEELLKTFSKINELTLSEFESTGLLNCSNESVVNILKEDYSDQFIKEFYEWFWNQNFDIYATPDYDFSKNREEYYKGGFMMLETADENCPILELPGDIVFQDTLLLDYTDALNLACKKMHLEYTGLNLYMEGRAKVEFYDKEDALIRSVNVTNYETVSNIPVYKIKIIGNDITQFRIYNNGGDAFKVNYRWDTLETAAIRHNTVAYGEEAVLTDTVYSLKETLNIYGTLETTKDGIIFNDNYIWLGGIEGVAVWKMDDVLMTARTNEFFDENKYSFWPAFRFNIYEDKLYILGGASSDLHIYMEDESEFDELFIFDPEALYKKARVFLNDKQIN